MIITNIFRHPEQNTKWMDKFCEFLEIRNFYQNYIFFQVIQRAITFAFFQLQRCSTTHWKAKKLYFLKKFDFLKMDEL